MPRNQRFSCWVYYVQKLAEAERSQLQNVRYVRWIRIADDLQDDVSPSRLLVKVRRQP